MASRSTIAHKYKVGQTVGYLPSRWTVRAQAPTCKVVKLLPSDEGESLYRVKCPDEAFERMAKEGELTALAEEASPVVVAVARKQLRH